MTRIALIGSAGRGEDSARMDYALYRRMVGAAEAFVREQPRPWELVSGAAAWADHTAVSLFLDGKADSLTLHLPCAFVRASEKPLQLAMFDPRSECGKTANHYHRLFTQHLLGAGQLPESLDEIDFAIERGARVAVHDGFHARNLLVGRVDALLAMTFGPGGAPKDGGTAHTWRHSPAPLKRHVSLWALSREPAQRSLF